MHLPAIGNHKMWASSCPFNTPKVELYGSSPLQWPLGRNGNPAELQEWGTPLERAMRSGSSRQSPTSAVERRTRQLEAGTAGGLGSRTDTPTHQLCGVQEPGGGVKFIKNSSKHFSSLFQGAPMMLYQVDRYHESRASPNSAQGLPWLQNPTALSHPTSAGKSTLETIPCRCGVSSHWIMEVLRLERSLRSFSPTISLSSPPYSQNHKIIQVGKITRSWTPTKSHEMVGMWTLFFWYAIQQGVYENELLQHTMLLSACLSSRYLRNSRKHTFMSRNLAIQSSFFSLLSSQLPNFWQLTIRTKSKCLEKAVMGQL